MSTPAAIARIQGDGFRGVLHNWDGYPGTLGVTLIGLADVHLARDAGLAGMLKLLIDDHPAGWSSINGADWNVAPGWVGAVGTQGGPVCYCHGDRHEEPHPVTHETGGFEWAYVFDAEAGTMAVCQRSKGWDVRIVIHLQDHVPYALEGIT